VSSLIFYGNIFHAWKINLKNFIEPIFIVLCHQKCEKLFIETINNLQKFEIVLSSPIPNSMSNKIFGLDFFSTLDWHIKIEYDMEFSNLN
jgi:hypothetical protein